jgi:hypothetical protein
MTYLAISFSAADRDSSCCLIDLIRVGKLVAPFSVCRMIIAWNVCGVVVFCGG